MKLELLASTIEDGQVVNKQHLSCFVIDDAVAIDAGCLSLAANANQKKQIRDVVLSHAHIDHIAGLPLFVDDLFSEIRRPVKIHAASEVIDVLREHIFNWKVYPDFAELENDFGPVLEYDCFEPGVPFDVAGLKVTAIPVNHKVPSFGFLLTKHDVTIALTGDTAEMIDFWPQVNRARGLSALLIECAFPNKLNDLAVVSHHLTPERLGKELEMFESGNCPIYAINLKPVYKETTAFEIAALGISNLKILDVGRVYNF